MSRTDGWKQYNSEYIAKLQADAALLRAEHIQERACNTALRAELDKCQAALRMVEWVEEDCPWCGEYRLAGHTPDCPRQIALGEQP